jgi:di/tricarboxylate transporter
MGIEANADEGLSPVRLVTLICIGGAAAGSLVFRLDLGMLAVSAAVVLHLFFPSSSKGALNLVSWSTVLLICGVVTYMALLQRTGTITFVGESVARVGSPLVGALVVCAIAAATSAFASSAGVLGMLIPLSVPLLATGQVGIAGVIIALSISATVVDASPFSNVGALVLANCPEDEQERMFRSLFLWGMVMVVTAPLATWLLFVLTGLR